MSDSSVITVGFCPAWDITCISDSVDWGQHCKVSQVSVPAGKAMNISKALAWMGQKSTAAGLWGQNDWSAAHKMLADRSPLIDLRCTVVPGGTRQNITVIDTHSRREMHLRADCKLATGPTLNHLRTDLDSFVKSGDVVAFAGSMPQGKLLDDCISLIERVRDRGAKVVIDSSGPALARAVKLGGLYAIKPNLEELRQLLNRPIDNDPHEIIAAARTLKDKVQIVLASRGKEGALAVTADRAVGCCVRTFRGNTVNTVACGDYLLAGFLIGDEKADLCVHLENAVRVAAARAWGLTESIDWPTARVQIEIETTIF